MPKTEIVDDIYENLIENFENARNRAGYSILEMANICLKAKTQLKKKKWLEWLDDKRINLRRTQATKLIAIAQKCSQGGQSTDLLNKKGIEETYLITKVNDELIREELAGEIIEANFTVKQTKEVVKKIAKENKSIKQAIEEVQNNSKQITNKPEKKTVSFEDYEKLQTDYENLLKQKLELEDQIKKLLETKDAEKCKDCECSKKTNKDNTQITQTSEDFQDNFLEANWLKEPIETELDDEVINQERHSITTKGYEVPVPKAYNDLSKYDPKVLVMAAANGAKVKFGLDLL